MSVQHSLSVNPFDSLRFIGNVSEVSPSSITLHLPRDGEHAGAEVQVGDYVILECGGIALFGQLVLVGNPSADEMAAHGSAYSIGTVELLATLDTTTGKTFLGIKQYPSIGGFAYSAHPSLVKLIMEGPESTTSSDSLKMSFATLPDTEETPISVAPERMFGRHCAVLGTTGAGKSWSLARLVEECGKFRSKVILFDATGEFSALSDYTQHVYLGADPEPLAGSTEVSLPYFQLTESDLFAIFQPQGQSQAPKLRAAMKSLKLARLSPQLAPDGTIQKAHKAKDQFELETRRHIERLESNLAEFDIRRLTRQIHNECVNPIRSPSEPMFWGGPNTAEQSQCVPLINRVQDIVRSPNLAPIFDPKNHPSLVEVIENFLNDDFTRILRISLKHLSFAHHAREIIANATGRFLLEIAREDRFRENPVLLVLDEAHQFLNKTLENEDGEFPLDSFGVIAKEGRKYALSICIATQRPRDIPESVLSQMGTMLVHRLINDHDRAVVERAAGDMDQSAAASLPILAPGEAILIGVDFPVPLGVKIRAPEARPNSAGPQFQKYWK